MSFSSGYNSPVHKYYSAKEALEKAQEAYERGKISDTKLAAAQKKYDEAIDKFAEKVKEQEK